MNFTKTEEELFKKYGLNPEEVEVLGKCPKDDKVSIIYYLLCAYELARKNFKKGNLTSSSYASALVLDDNSVNFGINYNATRNEISSICAERMSVLSAFLNKVQEFDPLSNKNFDYSIKYILMSSYSKDNVFWVSKITPCADCLSWFNTGVNLTLDTRVCFLTKKENQIVLKIQNLDSFLPLRNLHSTTEEIKNPKIIKSKKALEVDISDNEILKLYNKTYSAFKNNTLAKTSSQNIASGVLMNGEIFTGIKIDFSKRWFTEPLMAACYKGIEKFGAKSEIKAVCFVGDEFTVTESGTKTRDGIVSIKTLGRINTRFAKDETLVIIQKDGALYINTISDYMPNEHKFIHKYKII